jgi:hypothetical protein
MDFGVFYTCYKEERAVEHSLQMLYSLYPDCPVYLVSDGGSEYAPLEKKFSNLKTILSHDSKGFVSKIKEETYRTEEMQKKILHAVYEFFENNMRAIEYCKKPYMMVMEPDVLVRGKVSFPPGAKLLGSRVNEGLSQYHSVLSEIPGSFLATHWGAVPAIYDVDAFKEVNNFLKGNRELVERFALADCRFANYDVALAILFGAVGYEETLNRELTECLRNPYWRYSGHPILHQYREYYPKKEGEYEGRHQNARKNF